MAGSMRHKALGCSWGSGESKGGTFQAVNGGLLMESDVQEVLCLFNATQKSYAPLSTSQSWNSQFSTLERARQK